MISDLGCCFRHNSYTGLNLEMTHTGGHSEGSTFNLVGEVELILLFASLHSFIKCLTILPVPTLINLLHFSSSSQTHTHTHAAESTSTHSIHVASVGVNVCFQT